MSLTYSEEQVKIDPTANAIRIIDVGRASKGLVEILRDQVRAGECRKRGVRFLPEQVIRRLVFELKFTPGRELAIKPDGTHLN